MSRYYEIFGNLRINVLSIAGTIAEVKRKALAFAKSQGAVSIATRHSLRLDVAFVFDKIPLATNWKKVRDSSNQYLPKRSSKTGREVDAALQAIIGKCPSMDDVGNLVGMNCFDGWRWQTPGITWNEKRIVLTVPDSYSPPKKVAKQMKRMTDVSFEKFSK